MSNKLEWYVFRHSYCSDKIEPFNVFDSGRFQEYLVRLKKELKGNFKFYGDNFKWFSESLKSYTMYCFWCKSEYEIVITNLFASIDKNEVQRIKDLQDVGYCESVNLKTYEKVDIYSQLELNWDKFAKYVFDNINSIEESTKRRK